MTASAVSALKMIICLSVQPIQAATEPTKSEIDPPRLLLRCHGLLAASLIDSKWGILFEEQDMMIQQTPSGSASQLPGQAGRSAEV